MTGARAPRRVPRRLGGVVLSLAVGITLSACSPGAVPAPTTSHATTRTTATPTTGGGPPAKCLPTVEVGRGQPVAPSSLGNIDFLSASVGLALTAASIPCEVPGRGWYQQPQAVRLAVSTDGGLHWVTQGEPLPSGKTFSYLQFIAVSTSVAWALPNQGSLLFTTDGGTTWTPQVLSEATQRIVTVGSTLWALGCPSAKDGSLSCVDPVIQAAPLSGGLWRSVPVPQLSSNVAPLLEATSPSTAVLIAEPTSTPGGLWVTENGGGSWASKPLPAGPLGLCEQYPDFTSEPSGDWWLLCIGGAAAGSSTKALMRSTDDGSTWITISDVPSLVESHPPNSLTAAEPAALAAASPGRLWLATFNSLTQSVDGGVTWNTVKGVNTEGAWGAFDILSLDQAWFLAPGTGLWGTTDGTTWRALGAVNGPG